MTPEQAKKKFQDNLNLGLLVVVERLKQAFEKRAEIMDLTAQESFQLTVMFGDIKFLRNHVAATALTEFQNYLDTEGWDLEVRLMRDPADADTFVDYTFVKERELTPEKPKTAREMMIDDMINVGVKAFNKL